MKVLCRLSVFLLLSCCPALAGQSAGGDDWKIASQLRQGDCTLQVLLQSEVISTADDLRLRIETEAPEQWRIESVDFHPGQFTILEQTKHSFYRADSGRIVSEIDYRLEPFLPRDYRIPGARVFLIRDAFTGEAAEEPERTELDSGELVVRVVSAAPDDLTTPGIISEPVDLPREGSLRGAVFASAAVLFAAGLWLLRSRKIKMRTAAVPSAREIARNRVQSLLESGLLDRKEFPLFFAGLSGAILPYAGCAGEAGGGGPAEDRAFFALDDPVKTTALREFLDLSERVRFAGHEPSEREVRRALECCIAILREDGGETVSGSLSAASAFPGRSGA